MTIFRTLALVCLFSLHFLSEASAQEPIKGIVWNAPSRFERAADDLIEMGSLGVEAIRTEVLQDARLYQLSDSLGLALYQDLPFDHLSSSELVASLGEAKKILETALQQAVPHPSARHFGLTAFSNTSSANSCKFLNELASYARSRFGNRFTFYYTTFFLEQELCNTSVDLVLINVLNEENFSPKLERWAQAHPNTPVGLANIGTWILSSANQQEGHKGYLQRNSLEYQARFLENTFTTLFAEDTRSSPEVVFVYRWRDTRLSYPSSAHNLSQPYRHPYGIRATDNQLRPSYNVVKGFYQEAQNVFAFTAGEPQQSKKQWVTLFMWLNFLILSIAYAYFPRFRLMARRYFTAHGFFREAIREGRELLLGPNILIFLILSSAFGLTMVVILDALRENEAFSLLLRWIPNSASFTIVALLAQPILLFIALSGAYGLLLSFWTSALSAISTRSRWTLLPGQSFMLVLWSQWPLLIAMVAAGVVHTMNQPHLTQSAFLLSGSLFLFIAASLFFTLRDYWHISKANPALIAISLIINPITVLFFTLIYYCIQYSDRFLFALQVARVH